MNIVELFQYAVSHLVEIMACALVVALVFRFLAFRGVKRDQVYYNTFSRSAEKLLENDNVEKISDVETWLEGFLLKVQKSLPSRGIRSQAAPSGGNGSSFRDQDKKESLEAFAEGKLSVIHGVKQNLGAFSSPHPPDFYELTNDILIRDNKWQTIAKVVRVDTLSRILDILPGLFIVGGIFGTFVGITMALPQIANIDLSNLDMAGPVLQNFVESVSYSMKTSIAGICYSVVMTVLNTLFPISTGRNNVKRNLERALEAIWFRIHGNKLSHGDAQMIHLLSQINMNLNGGTKKAKEPRAV